MVDIADVAGEVMRTLPCFGLRVKKLHAALLAAAYVLQRPVQPLDAVAAMLVAMPLLNWEQRKSSNSIKMATMSSLVEHLDGMYFVGTFEHDGQREEGNSLS